MPILSGLFSLANGIGQSIKGHNMNPVRPEYEIPEERKRALGLRQLLLNAGMPGDRQMKEDVFSNQAKTMGALERGAGDQSQYLAGLMGSQSQTNQALNNLELQRARSYANRLAGLERQQDQMATAKNTAWQLNKYEPYLQKMALKQQLINSGNQNISSGLSGLTASAENALSLGLGSAL